MKPRRPIEIEYAVTAARVEVEHMPRRLTPNEARSANATTE